MSELIDLYSKVSTSLGLSYGADGYMTVDLDGDGTPAMVEVDGKQKRLVMPIRSILEQSRWDAQVAFHPLSESTLRDESAVFRFLKTLVNFRLNSAISTLFTTIVDVVTDPTKQGMLGSNISMFEGLENGGAQIAKKVNKICLAMDVKTQRRFINVYLKKAGMKDGKTFNRLASVGFPIYAELMSGENEVFGVKLTKKENDFILEMLRIVFPMINQDHSYSLGSNNSYAPLFDALMRAYHGIAEQINTLLWAMRACIEDVKMISVDFMELLAHIDKLRMLVPPLEGNQGDLPKGAMAAPPSVPVAAPVSPTTTMPTQVAGAGPSQPSPSLFSTPITTPTDFFGNPIAPQPKTEADRDLMEWQAAASQAAVSVPQQNFGIMGTQLGGQTIPMGMFPNAMACATPQFPTKGSTAPIAQPAPTGFGAFGNPGFGAPQPQANAFGIMGAGFGAVPQQNFGIMGGFGGNTSVY